MGAPDVAKQKHHCWIQRGQIENKVPEGSVGEDAVTVMGCRNMKHLETMKMPLK